MEGVGHVMKIFSKDKIPGTNLYRINIDSDKMLISGTKGSFNVICARLYGLSYANYLRMCRDWYGAQLVGKGSLYVVPRFKDSKLFDSLIEDLNKRAELVLWDREHKDFDEHLKTVEAFHAVMRRLHGLPDEEPHGLHSEFHSELHSELHEPHDDEFRTVNVVEPKE